MGWHKTRETTHPSNVYHLINLMINREPLGQILLSACVYVHPMN